MAKKSSEVGSARCADRTSQRDVPTPRQKPSALVDTRAIYCGDNLEQLKKLPDACVDLKQQRAPILDEQIARKLA